MLSWQYTLEDTPKHTKTLKQSEKLVKLVKLHFIDKNNLEAQVNQETIKKISAKDSEFGILFLELYIVLKILQNSDQLTQEKQSQIVIASMIFQELELN